MGCKSNLGLEACSLPSEKEQQEQIRRTINNALNSKDISDKAREILESVLPVEFYIERVDYCVGDYRMDSSGRFVDPEDGYAKSYKYRIEYVDYEGVFNLKMFN